MSVIRSVSLTGFTALVRSLGGDPVEIAAAAGLPAAAIDSVDLLVPVTRVALAAEIASERLGCPDFGLRSSHFEADHSLLGALAVALLNAPTMGDCLRTAQKYLRLHSPGVYIGLEPDPYGAKEVVGLRHAWADDLTTGRQMLDRALLNLHFMLSTLAGGDYGLRSVEIGYRPPAPLRQYEEEFGARVNPGQPQSMLRVPRALLTAPVSGADESLHRLATFYLAEQQPPAGEVAVAQTAAALRALLGTGRVGLGDVAEAIGVSPRTLQHRLAKEKATFGAVLDDVRQSEALVLLRRTDLSMADITAMLDLHNQATLSRAARRWWQTTPTKKRQDLLAGG